LLNARFNASLTLRKFFTKKIQPRRNT